MNNAKFLTVLVLAVGLFLAGKTAGRGNSVYAGL